MNRKTAVCSETIYMRSRRDLGICVRCGAHHARGTFRCETCTKDERWRIKARSTLKKNRSFLDEATRQRFSEYFEPEPNTGCHLWVGGYTSTGYGQFSVNERPRKAHRIAWLLEGRTIPRGMALLHKCDTPSCVNPDHLFVGSLPDNSKDMAIKGRGRSNGELPYGVAKGKRSPRYRAYLPVKGRQIHLGMYDTPGEAHAVALAEKARAYGIAVESIYVPPHKRPAGA